jgi:hypothetical protein
MGTSSSSGDGGMTCEERESSKTLVYQCLPSRYGFNPEDVRRADAQLEPLGEADIAALTELLAAAGLHHAPQDFKRVASARSLYHWNADADQTY